MDLRDSNESTHTARFSTGISSTSWGEHMMGQVRGDGGGTSIVVRGRPKGSFLTTRIGEKIHASGIRRDLQRALDDALAATN